MLNPPNTGACRGTTAAAFSERRAVPSGGVVLLIAPPRRDRTRRRWSARRGGRIEAPQRHVDCRSSGPPQFLAAALKLEAWRVQSAPLE